MHGACLPGGEAGPPEDPTDHDHRILALERRVVNRVEEPVDMPVQVSHLVRRGKTVLRQGQVCELVADDADGVREVHDRVLV